jgi:hypothetical protein
MFSDFIDILQILLILSRSRDLRDYYFQKLNTKDMKIEETL